MSRKSKVVENGVSKEDHALEEFKSRIKDIQLKPDWDDHWLKKWIKAREGDVDKAEKMFRASLAYREKMKVDTILEDYEPPEVIKKYMAGGQVGHDKDGRPVCYEPFGTMDIKGLMCAAKKTDLERSKLYFQESLLLMLKEQSEKTGKRVDNITVVFDMDGVGSEWLWKPGMTMYTHLIQVLEDNYPEMVKRLLVIRAPRIFPLLWKLGRPLLSDDMKDKVHVMGSDYKAALQKYIDEDQLPGYLGGKITDPDGNPRCETMISRGGKVPKSMYLTEVAASGEMETVTVPRGDKFKVDFHVDKPGSLVRWEIKTDDYDIGFGIQYKNENGKFVDVVPIERLPTHAVIEDGSHICEEEGNYVIVFDNSYSWTKSKKLHYFLELHTSDDVTDDEVDDVTRTKLVKGKQITHL